MAKPLKVAEDGHIISTENDQGQAVELMLYRPGMIAVAYDWAKQVSSVYANGEIVAEVPLQQRPESHQHSGEAVGDGAGEKGAGGIGGS